MTSKLQLILGNSSCQTWKCGGGNWVSLFDEPKTSLLRIFPNVVVDVYVNQMINIAHNSFGLRLDEDSQDGAKDHILETDKLVICYNADEIKGFASAKIVKIDFQEVFFIHGIAISPEYQGNGCSRSIMSALLSLAGDRKVAFTTQSPIAYCSIAKNLKWVYPNETEQFVPAVYRKTGMLLAKWRSSGIFNSGSSVIQNLYDDCLYRRIPISTRPEVNEWFTQKLNIEDGYTRNGILFVGGQNIREV